MHRDIAIAFAQGNTSLKKQLRIAEERIDENISWDNRSRGVSGYIDVQIDKCIPHITC